MVNCRYSSKEFASLLGISKSTLLEKERVGVLPPPKREQHGSVSYRYYIIDDIFIYRNILNLSPLIRERRCQLFLNFQQGAGKSAIAANYIYYISTLGIKCLAVDLDPKGDLTSNLGYNPDSYYITIGEILLNKYSLDGHKVSVNGYLDLIPANAQLALAALELNAMNAREFRLGLFLNKIVDEYDLIVVDVNSHPDILTLNAIFACDDVIIPIPAGEDNPDHVNLMFKLLEKLKDEFPNINLDRILMFINRLRFEVEDGYRQREIFFEKFPSNLLRSTVRFDSRISEAFQNGGTVVQTAPRSQIAYDIKRLAEEILFS